MRVKWPSLLVTRVSSYALAVAAIKRSRSAMRDPLLRRSALISPKTAATSGLTLTTVSAVPVRSPVCSRCFSSVSGVPGS